MNPEANKRAGADAEFAFLFAFCCRWPGTAQHDRYPDLFIHIVRRTIWSVSLKCAGAGFFSGWHSSRPAVSPWTYSLAQTRRRRCHSHRFLPSRVPSVSCPADYSYSLRSKGTMEDFRQFVRKMRTKTIRVSDTRYEHKNGEHVIEILYDAGWITYCESQS